MQKITPFLWFDHQAEEAAAFYTAIFPNSRISSVSHYGEGGPAPAGTVMTVAFQLAGQDFIALNGGPYFSFTSAISFFVTCETQEEVDAYWKQLSAGGAIEQCGWLKDKYGVSWQIVPAALGEMLGDPDAEKARRVTQAMLQMTRLDIAALRRAYEQG
jgi:predicted 3-demethylubiquinone-9 3-methyltransferase (glyoxalase superfamily)